MKHFLFEDKEYEIEPYFKRVKFTEYRPKRKMGGGIITADKRQLCVVKMHYSRKMAAHKYQIDEYLTREGTGAKESGLGKDGNRAVLYGADEKEYRRNMSGKNFRIFLSPQKDVPLETLTKSFIRRLEEQTGFSLYWVAANHYNTAHPHSHILINGVDKKGRDVFFPKEMVKSAMRENARDICTVLKGERTKADMEAETAQHLTANRYTAFDKRLAELMKDSFIGTRQLNRAGICFDQYKKRLEHLEKLGLCHYKNKTRGYAFNADWQETLKTIGRYNCYLGAGDALKYTDKSNLTLYKSEMGSRGGIVRRVYKTDEVSDSHAVLLEGVDGKAYFVPLFYKPKVKEGDKIEIAPKKNEQGRLSAKLNFVDCKTLHRQYGETDEARDSVLGRLVRKEAERQDRSEQRRSRGFDRE